MKKFRVYTPRRSGEPPSFYAWKYEQVVTAPTPEDALRIAKQKGFISPAVEEGGAAC